MAALWRATGWYKRQHLGGESPAKPFRMGLDRSVCPDWCTWKEKVGKARQDGFSGKKKVQVSCKQKSETRLLLVVWEICE
ncbi:hypothetical protein TNCV_1570681 [Trichonephila clavipes]|uniref:Uncharacterized protein n=1 Tax=Trichonephila clavipes TaxID=2585209 RepID=A0A8X6SK94_TRICX|nr:hypothetical protein TNCV_1570681 [Trichonephila clavipes]